MWKEDVSRPIQLRPAERKHSPASEEIARLAKGRGKRVVKYSPASSLDGGGGKKGETNCTSLKGNDVCPVKDGGSRGGELQKKKLETSRQNANEGRKAENGVMFLLSHEKDWGSKGAERRSGKW